MSTSTFADQWVPRAARIRELRDGCRRLGEQARFYKKALGAVVHAVIYYRAETLRQIAAMSLGTGSLAIIGGTVAVVSFITMSNAGALASQGYNQLSQIGVEALNGFASAFVNT